MRYSAKFYSTGHNYALFLELNITFVMDDRRI